MQRRFYALTLALSIALILATTVYPVCYAKSVRSITYTVFNSSTLTYYELDQNYTGFKAEIVNKLTYNTTTNKAAIVRLCGDENAALGPWIELSFWPNGELHIWINDTSSNIEVGAGEWKSGNTTTVIVTDDGIVSVKDYDGNYILQNYGIGAFTLHYVGGHGETTGSIATAGYTTIEVTGSYATTEGISESVMVWIPIIVTFAMLGMVLGMIKKFSR